MYPVSDLFLRTLRVSHNVVVRVDAYRDGALVLADLPISGGEVSVDTGSTIRRTLSLTVADPALDPGTDPLAPLAPFGSELFVRRGIRFTDGTVEWCPLGRFRVQDVKASTSGGVSVTGADRGAAVQDARFTGIQASRTSNNVAAEIGRLITEVLSTVTVTDRTGKGTASTPAVYWERDRWEAINELGKSIGGEVYFDPDGNAVIAKVPSVDDPAVWWVDAGESGVLVQADTQLSREGTYNAVVASGENGDSPPVVATVTDSDPASPTRWGGPFGSKPYFYVSPLLTTQQQCVDAATSLLNRVRGFSRQLDLTLVPNPALEGGDVIRVRLPDGSTETHIVDGAKVPLDPSTPMSISTRSPEPLQE